MKRNVTVSMDEDTARWVRVEAATMTRKLEPGLSEEEAREDVVALGTWGPAPPDMDLLESAWVEQDRYNVSFWDALIVAAARRLGCAILLTEDLQDGQDLGGVVVRNPITTRPG